MPAKKLITRLWIKQISLLEQPENLPGCKYRVCIQYKYMVCKISNFLNRFCFAYKKK